MADDAPTFDTPALAVTHYQSLVASLESQLAEANADIADFTESSKELQEELEKELASMERSEKEMRRGLEDARNESEQWKVKYMASLKEHTATVTHMQKELESLRGIEKSLRTKLRDMEMDNDDLEKSDREKETSLMDLESRLANAEERVVLLEGDLVAKAQLEEELQRVKDELRETGEELAYTRVQLSTRSSVASISRATTPFSQAGSVTPTSSSDQSTPRAAIVPTTTEEAISPSAEASTSKLPLAATSSPATAPPGFSTPKSIRARVTAQAAPLARSTNRTNLAAYSSPAHPPYTPKAVRESRTDSSIRDMKDLTTRVRSLTRRLDSRRNLVMAGSAIPRANLSPASSTLAHASAGGPGGALPRSGTVRRLGALGESVNARSASMDESRSHASDSGSSFHDSRPVSRSGLRQSIGRTSIPVRPPSRIATLSATSTMDEPPRSISPFGFVGGYQRSKTPTSMATPSSMPFNAASDVAARQRRMSGLSKSTAVRPTTTITSAGTWSHPSSSSSSRAGIPTPGSSRPQSSLGRGVPVTPAASATTKGGIGGATARRASLALGRSVGPRKSSASGSGL